MSASSDRVLSVIATITSETGYGPDRDELNAVLDSSTLGRGLSPLLTAGEITYDPDSGRYSPAGR